MRFRDTGDREAFEAFFDRTAPAVRGVIRSLGVPPDQRDDLLQETYLTVLLGSERFDASRTAVAWIRGIARKKTLRARTRPRAVSAGGEGVHTEGPKEILGAREVRRAVRESLTRMHDCHREVLDLYYLQSMSAASIARKLGRHPSTVRSQIMRAVAELRRYLPPGLTAAALLALDLEALPPATSVGSVGGQAPDPARANARCEGARVAKAGVLATAIASCLVAGLLAVNLGPAPGAPATHEVSSAEHPPPQVAASHRTPVDDAPAPPGTERAFPAGPFAIEARVLNRSSGEPVPHLALGLARVLDGQPPHFKALLDVWRAGVTDGDGRVRFEGVPHGRYRMQYGNDTGSHVFEARRGAPGDVFVERVADVRGVVVDDAGAPVEGAEIWCSEIGSGPLRPPFPAVKSRDDGTFQVRFADSVNKSLWARVPGRRSKPKCLRFDAAPDLVRLVLEDAPRRVRGSVFDVGGRPADDAVVALYPSERRSARRDEQGGARPPWYCRSVAGLFDFDTVPPESYLVVAQGAGGTWAWEAVDLTRASVPDCTLRLQTGVPVSGTLHSDDGESVADRLVVAKPGRRFGRAAPHLLWRFGRTDESGRFRIPGVVPGEVILQVVGRSSIVRASAAVGVTADDAGDRHLALGSTLRPGENARAAAMDAWYRTSQAPAAGVTSPGIAPTSTVRVRIDLALFGRRESLVIVLRPEGDDPEVDPQERIVTRQHPECTFDGVVAGEYTAFAIVRDTERAPISLTVRAGDAEVEAALSAAN